MSYSTLSIAKEHGKRCMFTTAWKSRLYMEACRKPIDTRYAISMLEQLVQRVSVQRHETYNSPDAIRRQPPNLKGPGPSGWGHRAHSAML